MVLNGHLHYLHISGNISRNISSAQKKKMVVKVTRDRSRCMENVHSSLENERYFILICNLLS